MVQSFAATIINAKHVSMAFCRQQQWLTNRQYTFPHGGWSHEHIVNTFFRFCKLLFQKRQIGAFFLLQLHQRINQSFHDFIIHNCFHTVIERTYKLEETEAVMQKQIRVANHRIADLEKQMEG